MRLLVLDPSCILPWIVRHEVPPDVEVQAVLSFDEAERVLCEHPPVAAIVSLPPARLPWRSFQHLCASQLPPVPVLYASCLYASPADAGLDPIDGYAAFLSKPVERRALRAALGELLAEAARGREQRQRVAGAERPETPRKHGVAGEFTHQL